ncbi:MAG: hypothetical protein O3A92_16930 [Verrucomicrobia bacterium]|nr:hypothetical protein [Verrucomicrobiota bacterium]
MAKGNSSGCLGVAIVLIIVLAVIGVAGLFYLFTPKRSSHAIFPTIKAEESTTLVFQEGAMPRFPFPQPGDTISREQFVAFKIDEDSTELSRESFRKVANRTKVRWNLQTRNVADRSGVLLGQFELPWEIRNGSSIKGSSAQVSAEFTDESRANLLKLRRGDWVVVAGELSFDGNSVSIKNARLPDDPLPAESE